MATAAERKRAQRKRERERGLVPFSGMVHESQLADLMQVLELLRADEALTVMTLRNTVTGKFRGLKDKPKAPAKPKPKNGKGTFLGRPCIWVKGIPYGVAE